MTNSTDTLLASCTLNYHSDPHGILYAACELHLGGISLSQAACGVGILLGHMHNAAGMSGEQAAMGAVLATLQEEYARVVQGKDHNPLTGQDAPRPEA
jgi:hypothetical protein